MIAEWPLISCCGTDRLVSHLFYHQFLALILSNYSIYMYMYIMVFWGILPPVKMPPLPPAPKICPPPPCNTPTDVHTSTLSPEDLPGVPVACVSGDVSVSVKVRGVEGAPVPRVEVEGVVGGVHCLLAPAQVHILSEMAKNLGRGRGKKS